MMFNSAWIPENLVCVEENGNVYHGRHTRCGQYYIYVFFPKNEVFAERGMVMTNYVVDLQENRFEIIRAPEIVSKVTKNFSGAQAIMDAITDHFIAEKYRPEMKEITNLTTLSQRLHGKDVLNYTFQDTAGTWFMLMILPKRVLVNGEIESVIFVVQNMDEQKRREMEYQNRILESAEDARRANMAKTEFLRRMSHDIRTPINGILGMLNIGDHFPEDMQKQTECREKIRDASTFLFELVNDVLDMSKMESGEIELEEVPFDLLNLLDEVVSMIEVQAVGRGLEVAFDGRNVTFEFVCADTGKGMSKEFQEHMFEPFSQEDKGARTTFGGSGLGLSIVQKLVEKMKGQIRVVSEEGKGSTFTILFIFRADPLAVQTLETSEVKTQKESISSEIQRKVLLTSSLWM